VQDDLDLIDAECAEREQLYGLGSVLMGARISVTTCGD